MRRPVLIAFATGMALMALLAAAPGDRQQDAASFRAHLLPALTVPKSTVTVTSIGRQPAPRLHLSTRSDRPDRWSIGRDRTDRPSRDSLPPPAANPPQAPQD